LTLARPSVCLITHRGQKLLPVKMEDSYALYRTGRAMEGIIPCGLVCNNCNASSIDDFPPTLISPAPWGDKIAPRTGESTVWSKGYNSRNMVGLHPPSAGDSAPNFGITALPTP